MKIMKNSQHSLEKITFKQRLNVIDNYLLIMDYKVLIMLLSTHMITVLQFKKIVVLKMTCVIHYKSGIISLSLT